MTTERKQIEKLREALKELVWQVEVSGATDTIGHRLTNLEALRVARAVLAETEGKATGPRCKYCDEPVSGEGMIHAGGCGNFG